MATNQALVQLFQDFLVFFFLKRNQSSGCEFPKSWAWQHGKQFKVLYFTFHIQKCPTQA